MLKQSHWQTGSALVLAFGMTASTIAPFTLSPAAVANPAPLKVAQLFPSSERRLAIPAGTRIPVRYDQAEKLVVAANNTASVTLVIPRNIRSASNDLLIPAWSEVRGKMQPVNGGAQFVAEELVLTNGTTLPINGRTNVISTTEETRRGGDTGDVLKGAAIGAAGASVVSGTVGSRRITLGKVLLGAGAGALGGLLLGRQTSDVVTIEPNTDMNLTLSSSLALR